MPSIGILSAMEREVAPLLRKGQISTFVRGGRRYRLFAWDNVRYVSCGIGREAGVRATEALIAECRPDIVISAGLAGALTPDGRVGDTITPGTVIDSASDDVFTAAFGKGVVVSSTEIAGADLKRQLASRYRADAVDMEGAAIASVARRHRIPFCAVKSVSDELGFAMPPLNPFVTGEGAFDMRGFYRFIAFHPRYWPSVWQLAGNSRAATLQLCRQLQHLMSQLTNAQSGTFVGQALARPL